MNKSNSSTEWENLVEELIPLVRFNTIEEDYRFRAGRVADFILNDRARIVEPFKKLLEKVDSSNFIVGKDCYIHVNYSSLKEARESIQ